MANWKTILLGIAVVVVIDFIIRMGFYVHNKKRERQMWKRRKEAMVQLYIDVVKNYKLKKEQEQDVHSAKAQSEQPTRQYEQPPPTIYSMKYTQPQTEQHLPVIIQRRQPSEWVLLGTVQAQTHNNKSVDD